ncbi:biotin synthase BioB [bacterium]|nr:biotin synthase BioB [bacterium]
MTDSLQDIKEELAGRGRIGRENALRVLGDRSLALSEVLALSDAARRRHSGARVRLCSIVNARSGACGEDCAFCAQSSHHGAAVERYPLLGADRLAESATRAYARGAGEFSIVTSGAGVSREAELAVLEAALRRIAASHGDRQRCASLGQMDRESLARLKVAGLDCFHHNLETSRAFFGRICSTHSRAERVQMVRLAKSLGLRVCSGGIFGLGESDTDRVDFALELDELGVDSVPLNFLHPIPGTPLEGADNLTPELCLRIIAMFRLVLPERDIVICGGRQRNLRDLQPLVFWAGANGLLIGDYLTTSGRDSNDDLQMIADLGLEPYFAERKGPSGA